MIEAPYPRGFVRSTQETLEAMNENKLEDGLQDVN
jgi:hypothetical protein